MKQGHDIATPDFGWDDYGLGGAADQWYEENIQSRPHIKFQVADGYAIYLYDEQANTLHWVDWMDGYDVHPALIRGLTKADVRDMLDRQARLNALFGG